ncbi:Uncharacterised protein [Vibrio cholerae]|nr:Uncharacterised protein [Vibrio cholerae]
MALISTAYLAIKRPSRSPSKPGQSQKACRLAAISWCQSAPVKTSSGQ